LYTPNDATAPHGNVSHATVRTLALLSDSESFRLTQLPTTNLHVNFQSSNKLNIAWASLSSATLRLVQQLAAFS
jgi:hypothetical protein